LSHPCCDRSTPVFCGISRHSAVEGFALVVGMDFPPFFMVHIAGGGLIIGLIATIDRGEEVLPSFFSVELKAGAFQPERPREIMKVAFKARLPSHASPSAKYFWTIRDPFDKG
jgi:hypothetical protein